MKTDRELLELAAKAAGIKGSWSERGQCIVINNCDGLSMHHLRPRDDDGDALRLAVIMKFQIIIYKDWVEVLKDGICVMNADSVYYSGCMLETTRRAIIRAAAAIGEKMQ